MNPHDYCQQRAARSGSSFYYSFLFLPPARRQAIMALYAFCREVDDVVDECHDAGIAQTKLDWWRTQIHAAFAEGGAPEHPVAQALRVVCREHPLPREHFLAIIDGMQMDLTISRYLDFEALQDYCYHAASAVGLLAARIFGPCDDATDAYAHDLGIALQLTNIIRDVGEDARRGRIYLPVSELERFKVPVRALLAGERPEGFEALMAFQAARAHQFYDRALGALPAGQRASQRPGLVMAAIYRTLLREIERDGFRVIDRRTSLTPLRKLLIASWTWLRA